MTSLRSVLAFNMKTQRQVLGISQEKLARRVATSTHYISMIESEKKFPSPEMLERIACALEVDAPYLFSTNNYPSTQPGTLANFKENVINDMRQVLEYRLAKLNLKIPQDD